VERVEFREDALHGTIFVNFRKQRTKVFEIVAKENEGVELGILDGEYRYLLRKQDLAPPGGLARFEWDGRDAQGCALRLGLYHLKAVSGRQELVCELVLE
jgi:flagellar hook assembly protein FlgD